jgi:hypothetical protein
MQMSFAAVGLCVLFVVTTQAVCEDAKVLWRNNNITCPDRAVCADVFLTTQDGIEDEEPCVQQKIFHNCMCPGDSVCPFDQPANVLYASATQQQFTCRPVCQLPYCANIRIMGAVSQTTEQNAPNFGGKTYTRVNCRCAGHHTPYEQPGTLKSVVASAQRYNARTQKYYTEYSCSPRGTEDMMMMVDPCES